VKISDIGLPVMFKKEFWIEMARLEVVPLYWFLVVLVVL
jgi:hypothetical protein